MCGIVGLHLKNPGLEARLGEFVVPMLDVLASERSRLDGCRDLRARTVARRGEVLPLRPRGRLQLGWLRGSAGRRACAHRLFSGDGAAMPS